MQQLLKSLAPLLVHIAFCLLSAMLARYALGSSSYAILVGLPLVFLAVVLPTLFFGWPPPLGYLLAPFEHLPPGRAWLVSLGALLIGYAAFSSVTFGSSLLGVHADAAAFAVGAALLYVAHNGRQRARPEV